MPAANRTDFIVASLTRREPVLRLSGLSLSVVSSGIPVGGTRLRTQRSLGLCAQNLWCNRLHCPSI